MNKAHELLSTKDKWTQGTAARNAAGIPTYPESPTAECFCLAGALRRVYGAWEGENKLREIASHLTKGRRIDMGIPVLWNDRPSRKYSDVHALLFVLDL